MRQFRLPGNRIVKTAVAVFLTAFICDLIGWPPVFAVITAIVTLEPTVSDSIKKGIVRFPASAIGSAYAVFFIALFGNSPVTYTLAATLTIITCFKLRLHAGLLVATITAVAMVEVIYDNYLLSFFIRLGTTSIGIIVSTVVNMFILPPNYMKNINKNIKDIYFNIGNTLNTNIKKMLQGSQNNTDYHYIKKIEQTINTTEELIRFQIDESTIHPLADNSKIDFEVARQQIKKLRLMHYHLSNIESVTLSKALFSDDELQVIETATGTLANHMIEKQNERLQDYEEQLKQLTELFWKCKNNDATMNELTKLPNELVLLYELLSLFHLTIRFYEKK